MISLPYQVILFFQTLVAQKYRGAGLILYSDPQDYSVPPELGLPYPNGPWLPDTAAQRGSIFYDAGDPLTPHYPATGKDTD